MSIDLNARLQTVSELVSENGILECIEEIWEHTCHRTHPQAHTLARKVAAKFRAMGARSRTFEIPADGKTIQGDVKMPLGWDCKNTRLEIFDPFEERGRILADGDKIPCHAIKWSGATPEKGLVAFVIRVEDEEDLRTKLANVKGKIVYTPADPRPFKSALAKAGAAGVVTSYSARARTNPDAVYGIDGWSDEPHADGFYEGHARLPGIVISPQTGVELDVFLDRGKVKLKMIVQAEYLDTASPVISGYIDAPIQEEILAIASFADQGANGNASGCAVVLECLRVLQEGAKDGALAPLQRAVRTLLVNQNYGVVGFAWKNPGIVRRILGGINLVSLGRHQEDVEALFSHIRCPDANASIADTLLLLLADAWLPKARPFLVLKKNTTYTLKDNQYNDPQLGVQCPVVAGQDHLQHTSADNLEGLSRQTLHAWATIFTTYLHVLATSTLKEALWLAQQTLRRYGQQLEDVAGHYAIRLAEAEGDTSTLLARAIDHLTYIKEISDMAVMSAKRFMLKDERSQGHLALLKLNRHTRRLLELEKKRLKDMAGCEPAGLPALANAEDIAELRPFKKFIGTPTYESLSCEARTSIESPRNDSPLHGALFWATGKLTFAEILRRIRYEFGDVDEDLVIRHFRFMAAHELIQWLQPGEKPQKASARKTDAGESHEEEDEQSADPDDVNRTEDALEGEPEDVAAGGDDGDDASEEETEEGAAEEDNGENASEEEAEDVAAGEDDGEDTPIEETEEDDAGEDDGEDASEGRERP